MFLSFVGKLKRTRGFWVVLAMIFAAAFFQLVALNSQEETEMKNQQPATVYFTADISPESVMRLYEAINEGVHGKVGVKVHFGEDGNQYYVRPELLKPLLQATGGSFVETNTLYPGPRQSTDSHIALAKEHGFGYAPIDILDSEGETPLPCNLSHFNEVWVGSRFNEYDSYILVSHFKGHMMAGFGGAIKNISMGMGSRSGKTAMHRSHYPLTTPEKCINCGLCVQNCATNAITLEPLRVHPSACVGCGKCLAVCPQKCFRVAESDGGHDFFEEKLAEYAKGIADHTTMVYINFINNVSPDCDCMSHPHDPFVHDIGVLASTDPVALDRACLDMVNEAAGSEDAFLDINNVSGNHQLDHAESIGLGVQNYTLINLDEEGR